MRTDSGLERSSLTPCSRARSHPGTGPRPWRQGLELSSHGLSLTSAFGRRRAPAGRAISRAAIYAVPALAHGPLLSPALPVRTAPTSHGRVADVRYCLMSGRWSRAGGCRQRLGDAHRVLGQSDAASRWLLSSPCMARRTRSVRRVMGGGAPLVVFGPATSATVCEWKQQVRTAS